MKFQKFMPTMMEENAAYLMLRFKENRCEVSLAWSLNEGFPQEAEDEVKNTLYGLAGILAKHREEVIETGENIQLGIQMAQTVMREKTDNQDAGDLPDTSAFNIDPKLRH